MTEKEKPNLLLQMSPEPFFGPAAPDSCGTQQRHGLLGEPGEGSLGASWATTWQTSILNVLVNLQPDNPASRVDGKMAHLQTRAWSSQSLCWQNAPQYLASISIKISLFHRSCLLARKGAFLARLLPGEAATAASFPTRSPAVPTLPIFYSKLLYWIPRFVVVAILKGFKY